MTDAGTVAQAQLYIVLRVLEMLGSALRWIDQALPSSPQELSREDFEGYEPDVTSEVRRVIQCVLADRIDPAIAELRAASLYQPVPPESKERARRTKKDRSKKKAERLRERKA
jgi:hypothetical protein